jgi:hypothetical protein
LPIPPFREDGWLPVGHHPATREEIVTRFGGSPGSPRASLTAKLLAWRDAVRACGVVAVLLLNGSYVSAKEEPGDFDVLLIGPPDIQKKRDADSVLSVLPDTQEVERL